MQLHIFLAVAWWAVAVRSKLCPEPCSCIFYDLVCDGSTVEIETFSLVEPIPWVRAFVFKHTNITDLQEGHVVIPSMPLLSDLILSFNGLKILQPSLVENVTFIKLLSLEGNKLSAVPTRVLQSLSDLTDLILTENRIQVLEPYVFSYSEKLEILRIEKNNLQSIQRNAFSGPSNLNLDLKNNNISSLSFKSFGDEFSSLNRLSLENCQISYLEAANHSFTACECLKLGKNKLYTLHSETLKDFVNLYWLSLEENLLSKIHPNIFGPEEHHLKVLLLSHNLLSQIPVSLLGRLPTLKIILLDHNRITVVPSYAFSKNTKLTKINLSFNFIQKCHPLSLIGLRSLEWLELQFNNLTTLVPEFLDPVPGDLVLFLSPNFWTCDCEIVFLQTWFHTNKLHDNPLVTCVYPMEYRGENLLQISFEGLCNFNENLQNAMTTTVLVFTSNALGAFDFTTLMGIFVAVSVFCVLAFIYFTGRK